MKLHVYMYSLLPTYKRYYRCFSEKVQNREDVLKLWKFQTLIKIDSKESEVFPLGVLQ